jgi:DNA polymerase-3 subunit epsilon
LDKYNPETAEEPDRAIANDVDVLAEISKNNENVDFAGRIIWKEVTNKDGKVLTDNNGAVRKQEVFNFGKYKGWAVSEVLHRDPGYYSWMLSSDFTNNTKQVLTRIRLREFNNKS